MFRVAWFAYGVAEVDEWLASLEDQVAQLDAQLDSKSDCVGEPSEQRCRECAGFYGASGTRDKDKRASLRSATRR